MSEISGGSLSDFDSSVTTQTRDVIARNKRSLRKKRRGSRRLSTMLHRVARCACQICHKSFSCTPGTGEEEAELHHTAHRTGHHYGRRTGGKCGDIHVVNGKISVLCVMCCWALSVFVADKRAARAFASHLKLHVDVIVGRIKVPKVKTRQATHHVLCLIDNVTAVSYRQHF